MPSSPDSPSSSEASPTPSALLRHAATRAADDPFFLGWTLATYRTGRGLDERALAQWLGCTPDALPALALCRRPASEAPSFAADVRQIAAWAAVDADRLVNALRYAESLAALRRMPTHAGAGGTLLAARDREPQEPRSAPAPHEEPAGEDPPAPDGEAGHA